MGTENNLLNSKLLKELEITKYLDEIFKGKRINPYDDRNEISQKLEEDPEAYYFEEAKDELVEEDILPEVYEEEHQGEDNFVDFEYENPEKTDSTMMQINKRYFNLKVYLKS